MGKSGINTLSNTDNLILLGSNVYHY